MNHGRYRRIVFFLATAGLFALLMITPTPQSIRAAGPWYVAPGGDDILNDCLSPGAACATINGAIAKASPGDMIYVATGTYTSTSNEVVLLDRSVTLSGGWNSDFTTQSGTSTIDGEGARRGITVNSGLTGVIEHFLVQNGSDGIYNSSGTLILNNSTVTASSGRGIGNSSGTLTLNNSTVTGNHRSGIYTFGGTLTLNHSVVSNNVTQYYDGGGIYALSYVTLTINDSTISGNTAGGHGGGIFLSQGTLTLHDSAISDNTAINGGGIYSRSTVTLNNSTVSGNRAVDSYGGICCRRGTLTLYNTTVSGNTARVFGGVFNNDSYGTTTLQNTIVAGNTAIEAPDCSGTIGTAGYNLIGDTSGCTFTPGTDDLADVSANLGPLVASPEEPAYHPLLSGSPAIDAGDPAGCTGSSGLLLTDQRGAARVGRCDIGAYEYATPGPATSIYAFGGTPQRAPPNSAFWMSLQALVLDSIGSPANGITVTFSAPISGTSGTFADSGAVTTATATEESGIATAATFTANELGGSYTVTATVSGIVTPASFSLSNLGWYVTTNGNDTNDCQSPASACASIGGVLGKAGFAAGDTVLVAVGVYTDTGSEVVLLDKNARLLGGWDNTFTSQDGESTIDGENQRRGITVDIGVTALVERFVVYKGLINQEGGGIHNRGTLTLNNVTVRNNSADEHCSGGGIYSYWATLTLNNCIVSGNTANAGGGISNGDGTLILNNSTINGNAVTGGGMPPGGGIYHGGGTAVLNNSTVSGNTTAANGGGIWVWDGTLVLNNSTISGNEARWGGGGIHNAHGTVTLQNTIVADNSASQAGSDCHGEIGSSGYNLIGSTSGCVFSAGTGDLLDVYPGLFPLVGLPGYHPLLPGSPAIDAGNPAGCTDHLGNPLDTDQRGVARVGRCDIGAYEFDPTNDPLSYSYLPIVIRSD